MQGLSSKMTDPMTQKPSVGNPPIPPGIAIALAILAVSTASIFIRFAQQSAPSLVIAAYRLVLATLILAPVALTRTRAELSKLDRHTVFLGILSGIFLALHFAAWITSLDFTSIASSVVLVTTTPLWVALIAPVVLHEKLSILVVVGLVIALGGGMVVGLSDACLVSAGLMDCPNVSSMFSGRAFIGDLLALSGAFFAAGYMLIGRRLRVGMSLTAYTFMVYGIAAVVLVLMALSTRQVMTGYPPLTYALFLALAVIPQLIGHSTFNWALRYLPAAFVSITLLGEPVGSTILAYFILGEEPSLFKLIGAALILAGLLVAARQPVQKKKNDW
jgi:drug/metabolite transporter (DMT)-like permease